MTSRSHFHYFRDALFGLWLQTVSSGLSGTAVPSHSSYTTHLYTTKTGCRTAKWLQRHQPAVLNAATGFRRGLPSPPHTHLHPYGSPGRNHHSLVKRQLEGLVHYVYYIKLLQNIYWKVLTRFSLIFLSQCPHPKDAALSPPGNPSEMHPPLSTLPHETVAGKRQSPSHEANGKLTAEFSIRKTPKVLMLEWGEGSTLWKCSSGCTGRKKYGPRTNT